MYLAYIISPKFEQHHSNISRDIILDFVIYLCTKTICDVISFCTKKLNISRTREEIQKKKMPFLFSLKGLSNKNKSFSLHIPFKCINYNQGAMDFHQV